jgi:hypothetical protein
LVVRKALLLHQIDLALLSQLAKTIIRTASLPPRNSTIATIP